jgi:hypothetical protein
MKEDGAIQGSSLSNPNTARSVVPFRTRDHRRPTLVRRTLRDVLAQRHPPRLHSQFVGGNQGTGLTLHEVIQQALDTISDFEREDSGELFNDDEIRKA